jgi:hypothetical protein
MIFAPTLQYDIQTPRCQYVRTGWPLHRPSSRFGYPLTTRLRARHAFRKDSKGVVEPPRACPTGAGQWQECFFLFAECKTCELAMSSTLVRTVTCRNECDRYKRKIPYPVSPSLPHQPSAPSPQRSCSEPRANILSFPKCTKVRKASFASPQSLLRASRRGRRSPTGTCAVSYPPLM